MTEAEKKNIANLKSRVYDLDRQLREAEARLHDARLAVCGVKVGDLVISRRGDEYRVVQVSHLEYSKPWVVGVGRNKNGKFGTRNRNLFNDWTKKPKDVA